MLDEGYYVSVQRPIFVFKLIVTKTVLVVLKIFV